MKSVIAFLRLIRWLNLLYIALTQYLVQYTVIKPILAQARVSTTLNDFHFFLLVLSTVLVAAAGYIINDYFDIKMDEVNKPKRIFIDRTIHHRNAILLHQFLTGTGVLIAFYVAWRAGNFKLGFIHVIVAAFLWFYSSGYKRRVLIGNVMVAFLSAFVILIVVLYEKHLFESTSPGAMNASYTIFIILFFYFVFAFLLSLARELSKDVEDMEGDRLYGSRSVPIVIGIQKTKLIVYSVLSIVTALMIYIQTLQFLGKDFISVYMIFTTLEFPMLITIYLLYKSKVSKDFSAVSSMIKIVMFMGILSMLYFYFLTNR
jgi:4-hydroxybenzoate polyprenyltransferase